MLKGQVCAFTGLVRGQVCAFSSCVQLTIACDAVELGIGSCWELHEEFEGILASSQDFKLIEISEKWSCLTNVLKCSRLKFP